MSEKIARALLGPIASGESAHLLEALRAGMAPEGSVSITGLPDPAKALYLLILHGELARPLTVIVRSDAAGESLHADLRALAGAFRIVPARRIQLFPSLDADPYQGLAPHLSRVSRRVGAMAALAEGECAILVVPVEALFTALEPPASFASRCRKLTRGSHWEAADDPGWFVAGGYERVDMVAAPGEYSRRGGVVDIFPPAEEAPVRIELEGTTVDSIRRFDPAGQRSIEGVESCRITPAREIPLDGGVRAALSRALMRRGDAGGRLIGWLEREGRFPGVEACARLALPETSLILDHAAGHHDVLDEPEMTRQEGRNLWADFKRSFDDAPSPALPEPSELFVPLEELERILDERCRLSLQHLGIEESEEAGLRFVRIPASGPGSFRGRPGALVDELRRRAGGGETTCILMDTPGTTQRMREILEEAGLGTRPLPPEGGEAPLDEAAAPGIIYLGTAPLSRGFSFPQARWHLLAEREIFGHRPAARPRAAAPSFESDFRDLRPGDLLVHADHGIGRYEGLARVAGGATTIETMLLTYHGDDRLYVPMDRLDLIHRHSGAGDRKPSLDRLGGQSWTRTKRRVRREMQEMATELLNLYAARKTVDGYPFPVDGEWQKEFEAAFPYELTRDQVRSIEEVKRDMEGADPMDRLLCGDVGFGKTEVALRAAFKAVLGGKQVAVLAPTTVLAFQHQYTFRDRFAPFPIKVESLSRLRTTREQAEVVARVAAGDVDILIGTHRILSKDVSFSNLGLLVVDEEQRFGVRDKERIKKLKKSVDVLTLTATPIPRTLQMSLAGVLDLSLVETPPESRLAIQTHMVPFRESIITPAIRHELQREGQVYLVHNRVESIYAMAGLLHRLVPEARIAVAHGQMGKRELEQTMMRFVRGDSDVLVSTTIIENGLDIPRVNTLIVNRADRFGLAQLYQLRGRIGRSDRQAYAYLLVPPERTLNAAARRRLQVLQDFTELGSGFRIAAMDLEIRGAGTLLGARQHGHIAAVGFEMYCRMLQAAIEEMRGGEPLPEFRSQIALGVDLRIPESYITEEGLRLVLYRKVASARTEEQFEGLRAEMEDRFGKPPGQALRLIEAAKLRQIAERLRVQQIDYRAGVLQVKFSQNSPVDPERLLPWVRRTEGASFSPAGVLRLPARWEPDERIWRSLNVLRALG
jgi:transcription-repair coupling factor (superfamily II helicase)